MDKPVTALLFDFDGTLLDTNELITQTFTTVLGEYFPGRFTREEIIHFNGPSLTQTFEAIDPAMVEELTHAYRTLNLKLHDEMVREYDGVRDTIQKLKVRGLKLAIVSTKRRNVILRGLKILGLEDAFEVIISLDDVENPKPHPEPVLLALEALQAAPEEALMIGDNSHDIEGGKNAGVRTAGVAWAAKGAAFLEAFNPDFMLMHISDLLQITKEQVSETN